MSVDENEPNEIGVSSVEYLTPDELWNQRDQESLPPLRPTRAVGWEWDFQRNCSAKDCNCSPIPRDEEEEYPTYTRSSEHDVYSEDDGNSETDSTARQSPTYGWANENEYEIERDEDIKLAYEPRTSFEPEWGDRLVDSRKFYQLRSLHNERYSNSKYKPYIPDFAKSDKVRSRKRNESRIKYVITHSIAERVVPRPYAKRVVTLLSRTEMSEGSLNAYSFEEIALGLSALVLNQNRPRPKANYDGSEIISIQKKNKERVEQMKAHLNQLRSNESAEINETDFNTIKSELRKQHSQFRQ